MRLYECGWHGEHEDPRFAYYWAARYYTSEYAASRGVAEDMRRNPAAWNGLVVVTREMDWVRRETLLTNNGFYKAPVWAAEPWWKKWIVNGGRTYFVHASENQPGMLAYTENAEKGAADRQTVTTPGRFLKKMFGQKNKKPDGLIGFGPWEGHEVVLTDQEIAYFAEWQTKGARPRKFAHLELRFASTADEVERVYQNGPRSCMNNGNMTTATKGHHPARAYIAGDLELAYLVDPTRNDKIMARAICWPSKEAFGRCYPAPENWQTEGFKTQAESDDCQQELRQQLKDKGWTDVLAKPDALHGAKLALIPWKHPETKEVKKNFYLLPYLDSNYAVHWKKEQPELLTMSYHPTHGHTHASSTHGYVILTSRFKCQHCNDTYDEVDRHGREHQQQVYTTWSPEEGPGGQQTWCLGCANHRTFYCEGTGQRYGGRASARVNMANGSTYLRAWAKLNGMWECAYTGDTYLEREVAPTMMEGKKYSPQALQYVAFWCKHTKQAYPVEQMSLKYPGFPKALDDDTSITPAQREAGSPFTRQQIYQTDGYDCGWRDIEVWPFNQENAMQHWARAVRDNIDDAMFRIEAEKREAKRASKSKSKVEQQLLDELGTFDPNTQTFTIPAIAIDPGSSVTATSIQLSAQGIYEELTPGTNGIRRRRA